MTTEVAQVVNRRTVVSNVICSNLTIGEQILYCFSPKEYKNLLILGNDEGFELWLLKNHIPEVRLE